MVDGQVVELRRMGPARSSAKRRCCRPGTSASVQALEPLTVQVVTSEELEEGVGMNTWLGCSCARSPSASSRSTIRLTSSSFDAGAPDDEA